jgi:deoxyribodipyrimidine photo-lyase
MIMTNFPHVQEGHSFQKKYANLQWENAPHKIESWKNGTTGYPIVDAGMRELYATGHMHNRVRMITASFLTKHLDCDWRIGEKHFASLLLDFEFASNNGGWQWSASTGCDAQPYFRIFNPTLQSARFDPDGSYIKKWLPELAKLPTKYIHAPHEAPLDALHNANITINVTYPEPIVKHKIARQLAIAKFQI